MSHSMANPVRLLEIKQALNAKRGFYLALWIPIRERIRLRKTPQPARRDPPSGFEQTAPHSKTSAVIVLGSSRQYNSLNNSR